MNDKYYKNIKELLTNNEIYKKSKDYSKNKNELQTYYNVGKELINAGKHYGEGIIKKYAIKLTKELGRGYTQTRLKYYRRFYYIFSNGPTLSDQLTFSHYCEFIWLENFNEINYYIDLSINQNLSVRKLRERIKLKEYERLDKKTKEKLINKNNENNVTDFVKNPIIIRSNIEYEEISEKVLKRIILDDLDNFLKELGSSFCYIANEYKIKIGNNYNYVDILLFNIKYNCYVVVELKTTDLKKEHIGQIEVYMNFIDKNLKNINQDKTIGIIICRKDNKYIIEYSSDKRIIASSYEII